MKYSSVKSKKSYIDTVEMLNRGGSRTTTTSKMERFVIIVNGWKPLTIITKRSILDVAAALDAPLLNPPSATVYIERPKVLL